MRFLSAFVALSVACSTHNADVRADLGPLPERKDPGAQIAATSTHIMFDSAVDEDSALLFLLQLEAQQSAGNKVILVELDTPGGSVGIGQIMAKAIERSPAPVVCVVDGMAASMGLYLLQSCDVRVMTSRSLIMGHEPSAKAAGQPDDLGDLANFLRMLSRSMAHHITAKTKLSVDDYLSRIAGGKEFWMGSEDAVAYGFVDFTVGDMQEAINTAALINN